MKTYNEESITGLFASKKPDKNIDEMHATAENDKPLRLKDLKGFTLFKVETNEDDRAIVLELKKGTDIRCISIGKDGWIHVYHKKK